MEGNVAPQTFRVTKSRDKGTIITQISGAEMSHQISRVRVIDDPDNKSSYFEVYIDELVTQNDPFAVTLSTDGVTDSPWVLENILTPGDTNSKNGALSNSNMTKVDYNLWGPLFDAYTTKEEARSKAWGIVSSNTSPAFLDPVVSGGEVTSVIIRYGGSGFRDVPAISLSVGSGRTATAILTNGVITGVVISGTGTGYTSATTATPDDPPTERNCITSFTNGDLEISGRFTANGVGISGSPYDAQQVIDFEASSGVSHLTIKDPGELGSSASYRGYIDWKDSSGSFIAEVGFATSTSNRFSIDNYVNNSDIDINTTGTGKVTINRREAHSEYVFRTKDVLDNSGVTNGDVLTFNDVYIPLTGTDFSVTSGSTQLTGTGTLFTTELVVGDYIVVDGQKRYVDSITSNTILDGHYNYSSTTNVATADIVTDYWEPITPAATGGSINIEANNPILTFKDLDGNTPTLQTGYIRGRDSTNTTNWWFGYGATDDTILSMNNYQGAIQITASGNLLEINSNYVEYKDNNPSFRIHDLDSTVGTTSQEISFRDSAGTESALLGFEGTNELRLHNKISGGNIDFTCSGSGILTFESNEVLDVGNFIANTDYLPVNNPTATGILTTQDLLVQDSQTALLRVGIDNTASSGNRQTDLHIRGGTVENTYFGVNYGGTPGSFWDNRTTGNFKFLYNGSEKASIDLNGKLSLSSGADLTGNLDMGSNDINSAGIVNTTKLKQSGTTGYLQVKSTAVTAVTWGALMGCSSATNEYLFGGSATSDYLFSEYIRIGGNKLQFTSAQGNNWDVALLPKAQNWTARQTFDADITVTGTGTIIDAATGIVKALEFNAVSDIRLKKNVETYTGENIEKLRTVTFDWKDGSGNDRVGYIAQEVKKHLPQAVKKDQNGFLSVSYDIIHSAKIAKLEEEIKLIKRMVNGK